jgi:hypothetical protein
MTHRIHEIEGMRFRDPTAAEAEQLRRLKVGPWEAFSDLRMLLLDGTAPLELSIRPERALLVREQLVRMITDDQSEEAAADDSARPE